VLCEGRLRLSERGVWRGANAGDAGVERRARRSGRLRLIPSAWSRPSCRPTSCPGIRDQCGFAVCSACSVCLGLDLGPREGFQLAR
jgi:hypothetical protein